MIQARKARPDDAFQLMKVYQKARVSIPYDQLMLDLSKLELAITADNAHWCVLENAQGSLIGFLSALIDRPQLLCKITRLVVDPDIPEGTQALRYGLHEMIDHLKRVELVETIYTTTFSISLAQQGLTLEEGFNVFGVFPNSLGRDSSTLHGLTARYEFNVAQTKRAPLSQLHPMIHPFYEIARKNLNLPPAPKAKSISKLPVQNFENLPDLEVIEAPLFVGQQFQELKDRASKIASFYPFYTPNCLITDPKGQVKIFVKRVEHMRFAAIIAEHLEISVDPVALYLQVQRILHDTGTSYLEVINDAEDTYGIDCFLNANFAPCAYIPAFKKQGDSRRDYVVFGRSFEYLTRPDLNIHSNYIDFFKQYYRIERKNFFAR